MASQNPDRCSPTFSYHAVHTVRIAVPDSVNLPQSSADRKRIRDRRHQQAFSAKTARRMRWLIERVASCQRHHQGEAVQRLLYVKDVLRVQNEALFAREAIMRRLLEPRENGLFATIGDDHPSREEDRHDAMPREYENHRRTPVQ
ncbi:hypothetical protein HJFPF1_13016 [Paramyrothecium foliicola]|nr:hypothetical protein HJFPF1_13016 [Paramyrothecium foliicola]